MLNVLVADVYVDNKTTAGSVTAYVLLINTVFVVYYMSLLRPVTVRCPHYEFT